MQSWLIFCPLAISVQFRFFCLFCLFGWVFGSRSMDMCGHLDTSGWRQRQLMNFENSANSAECGSFGRNFIPGENHFFAPAKFERCIERDFPTSPTLYCPNNGTLLEKNSAANRLTTTKNCYVLYARAV